MADRLEQAMAELRASSDAAVQNENRMKRVLADLAHEFKTPLGLIGGFAEVLKKGIREREPDYYIDIILEEVAGLTDMVNEAIELSKLQAGYWQADLRPGSVGGLIEKVTARFSKRLEAGGFTLQTDVRDCLALMDTFRIGQVVSNFICNAMKYSDARKLITITTKVHRDVVTVTIGNSGAIRQEEISRIWDRDYGAKMESTARLPSQGIELDIAKNILILHHSRFSSECEGGMVYFHFTLERAK